MRVVQLSTFHEQCGIAVHTEDLRDALVARGIEVSVLAPYLQRGDSGWGEQPQRLWNRNRAFGFEALRVMRAVEAIEPDIVHAQINLSLFSSRILYNIGYLLGREKIPFIASLHGRKGGSLGRNFKLWRFSRGIANADVIVHSDDHLRELGRERAHMIPLGLRQRQPRSMIDARSAMGLEPHRPVLAHFGFLVPDKGIEEMFHAISELSGGPVPDIFYWVVGAVHSSSESRTYFEELKRLSRELGIEDRIHMTGEFLPEEEAMSELQGADFIVLNYRTGNSQGASGAVRKALSTGRPVAVSNAQVFNDVRHGVHTLGSPLAASLAQMLVDRSLGEVIAEKGRALCEEQSWDRVAAKHIALYESILARERRS